MTGDGDSVLFLFLRFGLWLGSGEQPSGTSSGGCDLGDRYRTARKKSFVSFCSFIDALSVTLLVADVFQVVGVEEVGCSVDKDVSAWSALLMSKRGSHVRQYVQL